MADKEFTYSDVSAHSTKKDLYLVIHDKVYNTSSFVDEHPYVSSNPLRRCTTPFGYQKFVPSPANHNDIDEED